MFARYCKLTSRLEVVDHDSCYSYLFIYSRSWLLELCYDLVACQVVVENGATSTNGQQLFSTFHSSFMVRCPRRGHPWPIWAKARAPSLVPRRVVRLSASDFSGERRSRCFYVQSMWHLTTRHLKHDTRNGVGTEHYQAWELCRRSLTEQSEEYDCSIELLAFTTIVHRTYKMHHNTSKYVQNQKTFDCLEAGVRGLGFCSIQSVNAMQNGCAQKAQQVLFQASLHR